MTYTGQQGASNEIIPSSTTGSTTTTGKPKIYGGFVLKSSASACGSSDTSTCNTCTDSVGPGVRPCNKATVSPSGLLTISGRTDNTTIISQGATPFIHSSSVSGTTSIADSAVNVGSDGTFSVTVSWLKLCDNDCLTAGLDITYVVGFNDTEKMEIEILTSVVDGDSTVDHYTSCEGGTGTVSDGFCHVTMYPGDKKAYAENLTLAGNSVSTPQGAVKWRAITFFYVEGAPSIVTLRTIRNSSTSLDSPLAYDNTKLPPDIDGRITSLSNNTPYCFAMANVDEAGNIYRSVDYDSSGTYPSGIPYESLMCVTPDDVVGLLDDKRCFIATAAFGSPFEAHVKTLRLFRDQVLKTTELGRDFVEFYYTYSPAIAKWISDRDNVRAVIRVGLMPFVGLATLSLEYGFTPTILSLILLSGVIMSACLAWRRRRRA